MCYPKIPKYLGCCLLKLLYLASRSDGCEVWSSLNESALLTCSESL